MPQLRSLYLQNIADWPAGPFEAKELALQIVDIVTLRPEIQLCYLGITNKCFEILETRVSEGSGAQTTSLGGGAGGGDGHSSSSSSSSGTNSPIVTAANGPGGAAGGAGIDSDDGTDDDDDDSDGDGGDIGDTPTTPTDADDSGSEGSSAADSDDDSFAEAERATPATRLHLREILFYDDRVAIFKARHARL